MAHDSMDFSPIPLNVFQTLSFAKALVNGSTRLSLDLMGIQAFCPYFLKYLAICLCFEII